MTKSVQRTATDPLRRHRRRRHERHRRGAAAPSATGSAAPTCARATTTAPPDLARRDRRPRPPRRSGRRRRRRRRDLVGGEVLEPRGRAGARAEDPGHPARRDARRADAPEVRHRRRRHARQDDDDLAASRTILARAGLDPTAVIGGKVHALGTNARLGQGELLVAEADESDGTFLMLSPAIAVVTNIDPEHLDHYGDMDRVRSAFLEFMNRVPFYGVSVLCLDSVNVRSLLPQVRKRVITYGTTDDADYVAPRPVRRRHGDDLRGRLAAATVLGTVRLRLPGRHHALNALAAIAVAERARRAVRDGLRGARRVRRHPPPLRAVRRGRRRHGRSATTAIIRPRSAPRSRPRARASAGAWSCVFQPHRYTRTRDLFGEFLDAFDDADHLVLTDIYAAGEEQVDGLNGEVLYWALKRRGHLEVVLRATARRSRDRAAADAAGRRHRGRAGRRQHPRCRPRSWCAASSAARRRHGRCRGASRARARLAGSLRRARSASASRSAATPRSASAVPPTPGSRCRAPRRSSTCSASRRAQGVPVSSSASAPTCSSATAACAASSSSSAAPLARSTGARPTRSAHVRAGAAAPFKKLVIDAAGRGLSRPRVRRRHSRLARRRTADERRRLRRRDQPLRRPPSGGRSGARASRELPREALRFGYRRFDLPADHIVTRIDFALAPRRSRRDPRDDGVGEEQARQEAAARLPERRLGVQEPAGRVRRPPDRGRRAEGPARRRRDDLRAARQLHRQRRRRHRRRREGADGRGGGRRLAGARGSARARDQADRRLGDARIESLAGAVGGGPVWGCSRCSDWRRWGGRCASRCWSGCASIRTSSSATSRSTASARR